MERIPNPEEVSIPFFVLKDELLRPSRDNSRKQY